MKKKLVLLTASACAFSLLAGCSSTAKLTYGEYLTLGEYKGLAVKRIKTEITDDMVEEEVESFLADNSTYTPVTDRTAEEGDIVNIDYTGKIDGEEFDGGSAEDFDLELGSGYFLEDLETALVGTATGETKEITVTFPEDYDEEVGGKEAVFTVTLNSISLEEFPEYTDEFVAEVTEYSTIAEFEESLKEDLYTSTEADNLYTAGADALSIVMENTTFNGYPQELYDACEENYDAMNQMYAEMFGFDVSELEEDEEDKKSSIEEMVKEEMVCTTIAEKENLTVSDEEYKEYLENNYESYGYESAEEYEEYETKDSITYEILTEKVQNFLLENADITEVTEDEYYGDEDEYFDDEDYSDDEEYLDGEEEYSDDEEYSSEEALDTEASSEEENLSDDGQPSTDTETSEE